MTYAIQGELKKVILSCTDIPETWVLMGLGEDKQYTSLPWASVLPETLSLTSVWQWDSFTSSEGGFLKVRRKYNAVHPMQILFRAKTAEEASDYSENFLKSLPCKAIIKGSVVNFEPLSADPLFAEGALDLNAYRIVVNALYGIYQKEDSGRIKDILIHADMNIKE